MIVRPVHEFDPRPLSQNFLDNLVTTWPHKIIQRHIDYNGDPSIDDQYKEWIQLQQREKDEFMKNKRTREFQTSSAHGVQRKKKERISNILRRSCYQTVLHSGCACSEFMLT